MRNCAHKNTQDPVMNCGIITGTSPLIFFSSLSSFFSLFRISSHFIHSTVESLRLLNDTNFRFLDQIQITPKQTHSILDQTIFFFFFSKQKFSIHLHRKNKTSKTKEEKPKNKKIPKQKYRIYQILHDFDVNSLDSK